MSYLPVIHYYPQQHQTTINQLIAAIIVFLDPLKLI